MSGQTNSDRSVFVRVKINESPENKIRVEIGGFRHAGEPWYFLPTISVAVTKNEWSQWINLSHWQWHARVNRSGGIAEWPALKLSANGFDSNKAINNCNFEVQLNDQPDEQNVIVSFAERSASNTIGFLVPFPLRQNAGEFETGSQMASRHAAWAREAVGKQPIKLKKFDFITSLWGHYDPQLERAEAQSLGSLGFKVLGGVQRPVTLRELGMRSFGTTWLYGPDPQIIAEQWNVFAKNSLANEPMLEENRWKYQTMSHWVISDEVSALDFRNIEPSKLSNWFREFLTNKGVTSEDIGQPLDKVEYPAAAMFEKTLPRGASLADRRKMYYAAKFGQWWSARQLRQTSDLIRTTFPATKTEALMPSHGFLGNAWGPANIGMSYRMLDIFELGEQQSVDQLSAEDWLGLNHMYGPGYTWSGGQTFGYYNAILRSAIVDKPLALRGLITPSDNEYLRLKAYSSLGQGAKSFFFWTFGPTFIGTENYWSDLKSEYSGIVKLGRALEKTEDVLYPAKTMTDPVAILYSVSQDIWNTDNHAAFVEKRLLWHALRHLQIQPNFLREEDVERGRLKNYKVLYITDWCLSRKASAAIDEWVKNGGVLYLSAGAATRDEFNELFEPPFANLAWGERAAERLVSEQHAYNERSDLPFIKPIDAAIINIKGQKFVLPAIGARLDVRPSAGQFASFRDNAPAAATIRDGKGQIIAVGFMPMLAYGQFAKFQLTTLAERWPPEPRAIIELALDAAHIAPIAKANLPVVETNLLTGPNGSALVLANYTYQPINSLEIELTLPQKFNRAMSAEGSKVRVQILDRDAKKIRLKLPLKWTDIIVFKQ